jgi:NAD(P)H-dependent flavin oxidoreductase YrpB (nitropropane dioxygenase family)
LGCEFVVFAGGIPKKAEIGQAKESGAKVVCFAPTAPLAHMLVDRGTDALILEGSEAGGHIGPVALSVLIQQILFEIDSVPIFIAGGIATGRMMAHLLDAAIDGNIAKGSLMAGQSVGLVSEIKPLKGILNEMVEDAEEELGRLKSLLD